MRSKKIILGLSALAMAFAMASCGSGGGNGGSESKAAGGKELDEEDKATIASLKDQLPDRELANKEVKWMAHYDINPSEGAVKSPGLELFEQKYGGSIKWIQTTWDSRYDDLANKVMGGESPDIFPASDMDAFPKGAIKGMFDPIDDVVALDSDLWSSTKATSDQFVFNGKHYVCVIDVEPNYVCVYNRKTIEDKGYDDPAQLLDEDAWTWDTFKDMCIDFTDQDNDMAALDGYWYVKAISESCGVPLIGLEDGKLVNNMTDPSVEKVQNFMYELGKNNVMFDRSTNGWKTRGSGANGEGLGSYQTLFIPIGLWGIEGPLGSTAPFGDMEAGEIMFVPMPRDPDSDTYYISSRVSGYNLCHGATNPEGFAAYMDCLMVARDNAASVYEKTLKEEYKWTDEMYEMRQRIYQMAAEHPVFNFAEGISSEMDAQYLNVSQATMVTGGGATTWTECVGEYSKAIDFIIKEANTKISDIPTE